MTDIDPIMQAAERWRANEYDYLVKSPHDRDADAALLADALVKLWPKGKRPVAIEQPEVCVARKSFDAPDADRVSAWGVDMDDHEVFAMNCHCLSCWTKETFRLKCFATKEEAYCELWHTLIEGVQRFAESEPEAEFY